MKAFSKYLFSFFSIFIVMSFILGPIPKIETSFGVAYANDNVSGCDDNKNPDGSEGVYRPGCDFQKDLDKADIKSTAEAQDGGIKKALDQYIGIMFGVVMMSSLGHKFTKRSKIDCPMNKTANITLRTTQLGSLMYLLGEVRANLIFRKASKIAVDKNFQAKKSENTGDKEQDAKNKEANDKQMQAYEALSEIYGEQVRGLEAKKVASILAEVAYLAALGIEVVSAKKMKTMCKETYSGAWDTFKQTRNSSIETAINASKASETFHRGECSSASSPTCPTAESCLQEQQGLSKYKSTESSIEKETKNLGKAQAKEDKGKGFSIFKKLAALWNGGREATESGSEAEIKAVSSQVDEVPSEKVEKSKLGEVAQKRLDFEEKAKQSGDSAAQAGRACRTNSTTTSSLQMIESTTDLPIYCCGSNYAGGAADSEDTGSNPIEKFEEVNAQVRDEQLLKLTENIEKKLTEAFQSGSDVSDLSSDYPNVRTIVPYPSIMDIKQDIYWKKSGGLKGLIVDDYNILRELNYSLMQKIAMELIYKKLDPKKPEEAIKVIAQTSRSIDFLVEEQLEQIKKSDIIQRFDFEKADPDTLLSDFAKQLASLRQLVIKDVHAGSDIWKELLNIGVKMVVLQIFLKKFIRKMLVTPKKRMWMWGIMSAINAAMIKFHSDALDEANKRLQVVNSEADRFASSRAKKTVLAGRTSGAGSSARLSLSRYNPLPPEIFERDNIGCAAPKENGGYAPAVCSQARSNERMNVEKELSPAQRAALGPQFNSTLGQLTRTARALADGGRSANGEIISGNLQSIDRNRKALRDRVEKLAKSFDKANKAIGKDGKLKRGRASVFANLRRAYKDYGRASQVSGSNGIFAGTGNISSGSEKDKEKSAALLAATRSSLSGSGSSRRKGLNLSFDDEDDEDSSGFDLDSGETNELSDFVVENEDINSDKDKNIFKLISHRYLLNYPVLLEEKKARK